MEAENKLYTQMHGVDGHGQPASDPPQYTAAAAAQPQQPGTQFQGYPPYGQSAVAASPYYAPPAAYGGGYVPPQQQQQQVTVVAANQSPVVYVQPVQSFAGAIVFSCFVFWCCGGIFGLVGFILASGYMLRSSSAWSNGLPVLAPRVRHDPCMVRRWVGL